MKVARSIRSFFSKLRLRIGELLLKLKILLVVLVVFVFVLLSAAMIEVTGQNFFCGTCHEMRDYYTWRVSAHKDTKCKDCHIPPGVIAMVKTKISALKEVYVHVTTVIFGKWYKSLEFFSF